MTATATTAPPPDPRALQDLGRSVQELREQVARTIVGQKQVVDDLLTAMLAGGHCLMVGVPGLAKTLLVQSIAAAVDLSFHRVQFTPDLMPADITGTEVIQESQDGHRSFTFVKGPIFAHIVLADEINRTPPKTQAALLQAMQERQVTGGYSGGGQTYDLPRPFFVLATQNPIEQEGTYPLPEAQLDRFIFMLKVQYPTAREELDIVRAPGAQPRQAIKPVLSAEQLLHLQQVVERLPVSDHVAMYAVKLGRASRPDDPIAPPFVKELLSWGMGPRASQALVRAAKARAALLGQGNVTTDHLRQVAPLVMRHRLIPNYHAEAQGLTADALVQRLLQEVTEPTPDEYDRW